MAGIIRVSEAATLGLHALAILARAGGRLISTREIAADLDVSEAHLAKVLQRLEKQGLVRGKRGPAGGFALSRQPGAYSLGVIYEAIDGPLQSRECLLGQPLCSAQCPLGSVLKKTEREISRKLNKTTLAEFARKFPFVSTKLKKPARRRVA